MKQAWTWQTFLSWAFGPRRLAQVAVLVNDAQQRAVFLQEVPEAAVVREQLRHTLRDVATRCEALMLRDEADVASTLASLAGAGELEQWKRVRLVDGCAALERMIGRRLATMAWLLRLAPAEASRAA